jgi:hypothetical protein
MPDLTEIRSVVLDMKQKGKRLGPVPRTYGNFVHFINWTHENEPIISNDEMKACQFQADSEDVSHETVSLFGNQSQMTNCYVINLDPMA